MPWHAKAVVIAVVAYAPSPIGLGPDVIPVRGHLDDRMRVPLGFRLAVRVLSREVSAELGRRRRPRAAGRQR